MPVKMFQRMIVADPAPISRLSDLSLAFKTFVRLLPLSADRTFGI